MTIAEYGKPLSSKVIGEFRYDLYEDCDIPYYKEDHCIYKALIAGQLSPYGICKMMQCECCGAWQEVASLWGVLAINEEVAMEDCEELF